MKKFLIVLAIIVVALIVWFSIQTKPDESIPTATVSDVSTTTDTSTEKPSENTNPATNTKQIDNANVKISFKGFGPGKVHNGSFGKIDSKLVASGQNIAGDVVVDMNSLSTDTEAVTKHLKTDAFFDVAKYPTATFSSKIFEMAESGQGYLLSGSLTVHGTKKDIVFPVTLDASGYTTKFNINMKEFGIDQKFANEVVEVSVTVPFK